MSDLIWSRVVGGRELFNDSAAAAAVVVVVGVDDGCATMRSVVSVAASGSTLDCDCSDEKEANNGGSKDGWDFAQLQAQFSFQS